MKHNRNFLKGALCGALVMLLAITGVCQIFGNEVIEKDTENKLKTIGKIIDSAYLRSDELDEEQLQEYILKGYVAGLNDPYSVYFNEEETKEIFETTTGEFGGIGALMSQNRETMVVTMSNVYKDSPADKAGFRNNDILYKVDGEDISGQDLSEIVKKVKGEKGTEVTITVLRGADNEEYEATVIRDIIEAQTVTYEMKEDEIGYIRLSEFDQVSLKQFEEALTDLKSQGMRALIVDLRGNPGGNLSTVCGISDLILPEGIIVSTKERNGQEQVYKSDDEQKLEIPLSVLVDGASASASEIFAGAVQDHEVGTIIGTTTYGKGVVQNIFDLKDGTSLKLTISEYFTPDGRNIDGTGIEPDVEVKYVYDEKNPEKDNQLEKALEVTKEKLK